MSYEPLHHKYRPQTFNDLVGQEAIALTLINAIRLEKIAPAYLFTGPRGTGKTSSARILAKSLNCLSHDKPTANPCGKCEVCRAIAAGNALDVTEIDAASNTGVDNIREIIERSRFAPVQSRYKVYAIDECHMLSTAAFNALLKTLEEPPPQVVFILATTDPQRVLSTIISRCQRFDYRRIPLDAMVGHLQYIANQENIAISTEALTLNAQIANGGLRDAESLLDQLSLFPEEITVDKIWDLVGAVPERDLLALLVAIRKQNVEDIVAQCRSLLDRGREPLVLLQNLASFYLNLLIAKTSPNRQDLIAVTETCWQQLCTEAQQWKIATILQGQQHLKEGEVQIKQTTQPRLWLEITLLGLLDLAERVATTRNVAQQASKIVQQTELSVENNTFSNITQERQLRNTDSNPYNPSNDSSTPSQIEQNVNRDKTQTEDLSRTAINTAINTPEKASTKQSANSLDKKNALSSFSIVSEKPPEKESELSTGSEQITADSSIIWQKVIDCIHPPMTQALLRQQCHLISLADSAAIVGISSAPLQKMNQGKVPNIEAAFAKVCGKTIKVTLEVAGLPKHGKKNSNLAPNNSFPPTDRQKEPKFHSFQRENSVSDLDIHNAALPQTATKTEQFQPQVTSQETLSDFASPAKFNSAIAQPHPDKAKTPSKEEPIESNKVVTETIAISEVDRVSPQTKIERDPSERIYTSNNSDDFAKAVELVAQKFDGEVIELKDSLVSKISPEDGDEVAEILTTNSIPITPEAIAKNQKVIIKRENFDSYNYDDDDVPF